jgi:hypothetical protein
MGQIRTSDRSVAKSDLPPRTDIAGLIAQVRTVPKPEVAQSCGHELFCGLEMILASPSAMIGVHPARNSPMKPDLQTIDTNGIRLRVAVAGAGALVILIHGFPESWYSWRHQIPVLADAGYLLRTVAFGGRLIAIATPNAISKTLLRLTAS